MRLEFESVLRRGLAHAVRALARLAWHTVQLYTEDIAMMLGCFPLDVDVSDALCALMMHSHCQTAHFL